MRQYEHRITYIAETGQIEMFLNKKHSEIDTSYCPEV